MQLSDDLRLFVIIKQKNVSPIPKHVLVMVFVHPYVSCSGSSSSMVAECTTEKSFSLARMC